MTRLSTFSCPWQHRCLLVVVVVVVVCSSVGQVTHAFQIPAPQTLKATTSTTTTGTTTAASRGKRRSSSSSSTSRLFVSIGLGPEQEQKKEDGQGGGNDGEETAVVDPYGEWDYEIPNHEEYRLSRRSKLDEECDEWFAKLLGDDDGSSMMGPLATQTRTILNTPVPLVNDLPLPADHPEWTPYVSTRLPWTPLVPAFGLEVYGLPIPRRNAETWRHFDVAGMIATDYSRRVAPPHVLQQPLEWSKEESTTLQQVRDQLQSKGSWLEDDECEARLIYINGRFVPQLSKTNNEARNVNSIDDMSEEMLGYLGRLTDGFTDELVSPCYNGDELQTSYSKLSYPDHNMGAPTSQFAINTQQGTACFAALNTIHAANIAFVHATATTETTTTTVDNNKQEGDEVEEIPKPVLIVQAVTPDAGNPPPPPPTAGNDDAATTAVQGVALHPRTLVVAEEGARLAVVQSKVDLNLNSDDDNHESFCPKLYNGYTQVFVKAGANVTHSYLEESGGMVTAGTEIPDDQLEDTDLDEEGRKPREVEALRAAGQDTHLEALDVHAMGEDSSYNIGMMCYGGSGRVRVALSVSLLQTGAHAEVNGFCLSGGTQRCDIKTSIHHIAQGASSRQLQKNMMGGRSVGSFRGRIRVEQSAQQTDSAQLSRSVLLSDKARAWAIPSLEIIADDVTCTHGATVSDLSDEELFYLRARGLDQQAARNLLMYAYVDEIASTIHPSMLGTLDGTSGLRFRLLQRLQNVIPRGERAVKAEYQSI